jgi:hypothetical protein
MDVKSSPDSEGSSNSVPLVLTFCFISLLLIYLVYSQNIIYGSKPGHWIYPYFKTLTAIPLWLPLSIILLLGLLIFTGSKLILVFEKTTLIACFLLVFVIQILIHSVYPVSLAAIVESEGANSFYTPAIQYTPVEILSQFIALAPTFPLHGQSNMPGKILLFQFIHLFTSSTQMMGVIIILISTLGGLLLYGICKLLFHDRQIAFYALILYALIPGKLFFFPILNTVTPVILLLCLFLFLLFVERKQAVFLWLFGASLYFLFLFEPAPLVAGIVFLGIFIHALLAKKLSQKELLRLLIIPFLSFLGVYLLFFVFFSFNLFQVFKYILADAVDFNLKANRPYWIWLQENPKEFFFAAGLPVMMIFIFMAAKILTQSGSLKSIARWTLENIIVISLLVTFCALLFLGVNRGEITRLWIYLAVLFQIPAASFLGKMPSSKTMFFLVAATLVIQSILTLQRIQFINPD